ncbi:MAG: SMI1/KNR4 family protein [Bacteroidota bacterium]|nr:SMI1/KNR4 family protein [Bacteroidota bacterium]
MNSYKDLIFKFEYLGIEKSISTGETLIGKAPHIAPAAWLNSIYLPLRENDVKLLEDELGTNIPIDYRNFLTKFSNGLDILVGTFSLDGLRRNYIRSVDESRQPFSIITKNIEERPYNAKDSYFFIGGYKWDGSCIYIDKETNIVHYCDRDDATSLFQWNSFEEMLISELHRTYLLFDDKGVKINEDVWTTPIER